MSRKVIVIMEIHDEEIQNDGIHYAIQESYGKDVTIYGVQNIHVPIKALESPLIHDIYLDAECYLSEHYDLSPEQILAIAKTVAAIESNNAEGRNNRIWDAAEKLGFIKEDCECD